MAEVQIVQKKKTISYSGLFNVNKFHKFLMQWFKDNEFHMYEERTQEQIFPSGKEIIYNYKPYKDFTDFANAVIYLDVKMSNVNDVTVEVDGQKKKMQKGDINIDMTGLVETDYESKWETKPFYYFFKIVAEKFFLGGHRTYYDKYVIKKCQLLYEDIKAMLNVHSIKS